MYGTDHEDPITVAYGTVKARVSNFQQRRVPRGQMAGNQRENEDVGRARSQRDLVLIGSRQRENLGGGCSWVSRSREETRR